MPRRTQAADHEHHPEPGLLRAIGQTQFQSIRCREVPCEREEEWLRPHPNSERDVHDVPVRPERAAELQIAEDVL